MKPALRWLAVVPLADAVTMPTCPFPSGVVVVQAFHGGLLGVITQSGPADLTAAGMGCQAAIEAERWLAEHGG